MFCKKCGAEIIEGAKFCASCGCNINDEKIPRSMNEDGKILLVAEPQKKYAYFFMLCGFIVLGIGILLLLDVFGTQIAADRNIRIVMSFIIIGEASFFFYNGLTCAALKITICENTVYGSYGYGIPQQFKFTYDDIINVSVERYSNIIIVTKAKSYTLVHMEHASEAVKMIRDRINVGS